MTFQRTLAALRPLNTALIAGLALTAITACTDSTKPTPVAQSSLRILHEGAPVDITPDGTIALLEDRYTGSGTLYEFNVTTGALTQVGAVGDILYNTTTAISNTGRITAMYGMPVTAGVWSPGTGWQSLPSMFSAGCNQDIGSAFDVSADGHVVVGLMWDGCNPVAFRWSDASGTGTYLPMAQLGIPTPGSTNPPTNRASKVSANGLVTGGFAQTDMVDRWPAIWRNDGSGFLLPGTDPTAPGEVLAINTDGSMVAGIWGNDAFYWTAASGTVDIGLCSIELPGDPAFALTVAAGNQLIFGQCGAAWSMTAPLAFVWTQAGGMQSLEELAVAAGIVMPPGYHLTAVTAASSDGTVLLGRAVNTKNQETSFVLRLPISAYGL